jgi:hypothetical protein
MTHGEYRHPAGLHALDDPIRAVDHLPQIGAVRQLRDRASALGEALQPAHGLEQRVYPASGRSRAMCSAASSTRFKASTDQTSLTRTDGKVHAPQRPRA